LYKKTPRFDEIPSLIGQLLISAISINSGYTSRIVVSTRFRYRKVTSIRTNKWCDVVSGLIDRRALAAD